MKKILFLLMALTLVCGFVACGGNTDSSSGTGDSSYTSENSSNASQTYTITLDIGGVANLQYSLSVSSITLKHGDTIELPTPTCAGYTFKYWSLEGREFTDETFTLDRDIVLMAEWKEGPQLENH